MPIQTSTTTTSGNLTQHEKAYRDGVRAERLYDQFASTMQEMFEPKGSTATAYWVAPLLARPTTAIGSEQTDFDPQTVRDVSANITKAYYADGVSMHDLVGLKNSLGLDKLGPKIVGELAMRTIDALARRAATEGGMVFYGDGTHSTRITLIPTTAADNMTPTGFIKAATYLSGWDVNEPAFVILDPYTYADLIGTAGNSLVVRAGYTEEGAKILYNMEVATLDNFKIIRSPWAKMAFGAAAANASSTGDLTLATAVVAGSNQAGSRYVELSAATNLVAGKSWIAIGTSQTGAESDATIKTEPAFVTSISSTTIGIIGMGPGHGLLYDHAVGDACTNDWTAHLSVFGHRKSLAVDYDGFGRYGKLIPAFQDGKAKQWTNYSFKVYTGYGRLDEGQLVRWETSATTM